MGMNYAEAQYVIDSFSTEHIKQERSGLPPSYFEWSSAIGDGNVMITFKPNDTILENQLITRLEKIVFCLKEQNIPQDPYDCDISVTLNRNDLTLGSYNEVRIPNLANGVKYGLRIFPFSDHNVYSKDPRYSEFVIPAGTWVVGFHQDFTNTNPDSSITYIADSEKYIPMSSRVTSSRPEITMGSWGSWGWLKNCKPFLITKVGKKYAQLNPDNYNQLIDGSKSGLEDNTNINLPFVWFPKIYKKEVYSSDGSSRDVYFSKNNTDTNTRDFEAVGFNVKGTEVEGLWIPMFYPSSDWSFSHDGAIRNEKTVGFPSGGMTVGYISDMSNVYPTSIAFGFPLISIIRDLLYLLYKTTNIQIYNTNGTSGLTAGEIQNNVYYPTGGAFYSTPNSGGKCFHSTIISSGLAYISDPYCIIMGSENQSGSLGCEHRYYLNYDLSSATNVESILGKGDDKPVYDFGYPSYMIYLPQSKVSVPSEKNISSGSANTGLCDKFSATPNIVTDSGAAGPVSRFGFGNSMDNGITHESAVLSANSSGNRLDNQTLVPVIVPSAGYTPYD